MLSAVVLAILGMQAVNTPASIDEILTTAEQCVLAVGSNSVDARKLTDTGWTLIDAKTGFYRKQGSEVSVTLPADRDGIRRICVVEALSHDAEMLSSSITAHFEANAFDQSDSKIWLFERAGVRGLQLFVEGDAPSPFIRLIAAYFAEKK